MSILIKILYPIGKLIKKPKGYDPAKVPAFKNTTWVIKEDLGKNKIWERIS